jgi:hypothetical protein
MLELTAQFFFASDVNNFIASKSLRPNNFLPANAQAIGFFFEK